MVLQCVGPLSGSGASSGAVGTLSAPTDLSLSCSGREPSPQEEAGPRVGCRASSMPTRGSVSVALLLVWGNDTILVYYGKPPGQHKEKQVQQLIGKCSVY